MYKPKISKVELPRWKGIQRRIGITGGIATGKSMVGQFISEIHKLPVLDADILAREALAPGEIATQAVLTRYGNLITQSENDKNEIIDRSALAKIIFRDTKERLWIERLVHPIIRQKLINKLSNMKNESIIILVIPLLFEANFTDLCSDFWVVYCSQEKQVERLMSRNQTTRSEANLMIHSQWSIRKKKYLADLLIENSGSIEELKTQVQEQFR